MFGCREQSWRNRLWTSQGSLSQVNKTKMTDSPPDDARMRATEAQMRHVLGLTDKFRLRHSSEHSLAGTPNGSQAQRHGFVREGEVPVTIVRRERHADCEPASKQL